MPAPPSVYLRFERAFRRGDHLNVLAEGDRVADHVSTSNRTDLLADVLVQIGAVHAAQDRYGPAIAYLEQGLGLAAAETASPALPPPGAATPPPVAPPPVAPPPVASSPAPPSAPATANAPSPWAAPTTGGPFGPPPDGPFSASGRSRSSTPQLPRAPGATGSVAPAPVASGSFAPPAPPSLPRGFGAAPPGGAPTRAARAANRLDWFELALLDIDLRTGRYDDVLARVPRLVDPTHAAEVRFTATRAHAAVLGARAQEEAAHHLLNTAGGIAARIRSRFRTALVEGDRAVLLARQGRLLEAITSADRVLPSMIRPPVGVHQQWSNAEGAAVALTVCRAAVDRSDHLTAQRMLHLATTATQRIGSAYLLAHIDLARGQVWLLEGDLDDAEASLVAAGRQFATLGCAPASAATAMTQGALAARRGLIQSARPLYRRALDDYRRLGHAREVNELTGRLHALDHRLSEG